MPRHYRRKTHRGLTPHETMKDAVSRVINGESLREVAKTMGISKSSLHRNVGKFKKDPDSRLEPNYTHKQVFSVDMEQNLANYLKTCSQMFYGLTPRQVRVLAFELGSMNNLNMPDTWTERKMAGKEWLHHFLLRNPQLSIRQPEATSLARASSFNRTNIAKFFDNLEELIMSTKATGFVIYNLDESGCTTVQGVPKVVAPRGQKQVGQITSQERGELVTICGIVSATGNAIPPVFLFPRKNFKTFMTQGSVEGAIGFATGNGWMNSETFPKVLEHFMKHSRPSEKQPVILIYDNHNSHLSLAALELAKKNHVHVLTLPPHTSNKTQPLDRTVFGPFKTFYNAAANSLMMKRPGQNITIYDMATLMSEAWLKAATPPNIIAGFAASGIWPYKRDVFSDEDFLPANVTDRPVTPSTSAAASSSLSVTPVATLSLPFASASSLESSTGSRHTAEALRGYPKATFDETRRKRRTAGHTKIATSTPEMSRIRESCSKRGQKKAKRVLFEDSDSDMDIDIADCMRERSDSEFEDQNESECHIELLEKEPENVGVGSYVLCEFEKAGKCFYYAGKVLKEADEEGDLEIEFLKKSQKSNNFLKPHIEDIASFPKSGVRLMLPQPKALGQTKRTQNVFMFDIDLSRFDVR